jgi:hypothetical protein
VCISPSWISPEPRSQAQDPYKTVSGTAPGPSARLRFWLLTEPTVLLAKELEMLIATTRNDFIAARDRLVARRRSALKRNDNATARTLASSIATLNAEISRTR